MKRGLAVVLLCAACKEVNSLSGSMSEVFPLEVPKVELPERRGDPALLPAGATV